MNSVYRLGMILLLSIGTTIVTHATTQLSPQDNGQCYDCKTYCTKQDTCKTKEEDERIEHLAIATVANIAQGIVHIGNNPDDSELITHEVVNIMGTFANLVIQAMKNPAILQLLSDEEWCNQIAVRVRSKLK